MWKGRSIALIILIGTGGFFMAQNSFQKSKKDEVQYQNTRHLDSLLERTGNLYAEGRYNEMLIEAEKGIVWSSEIPEDSFFVSAFIHQKANAYYGKGDFVQAIEKYNQAIARTGTKEVELNLRAQQLFDRANAEYQLELMGDCFRSTLASEAILASLKNPDPDYLISVYNDLAFQCRQLAYYTEARQYLNKAKSVYEVYKLELEQYDLEVRKPVSFAYTQLLIEAESGEEDRMLESLDSLHNRVQSGGNTRQEMMRLNSAYMTVADFYINELPRAKKLEGKARKYLKKTKETYRYTDNPEGKEQLLFNEAKMNYNLGNYNRASRQFSRLLSSMKKFDPRKPFYYVMGGLTAMKLQDSKSAADYIRAALESTHLGQSPLKLDLSNYKPSANIIHATLYAETADTIANFDSQLFNEVGRQLYYAGAGEFEENYRGKVFNDRLKSTYELLFQGRIEPLLKEGNGYRKQDELATIVTQFETIQNQLLWSRFLKNRKFGSLKVPQRVRLREQALRLSLVDARISGDANEVFEVRLKLKKLESEIEKKYPKYASFSQSEFNLSAFQSKLREHELVLQFVEANGTLYRFAITKNEVSGERLERIQEINNSVHEYLAIIRSRRENKSLAKEIASKLLPSNHKEFKKIVIVNHSALVSLPFEALCDKNEKYLIYTHTIRYAPHLVFVSGKDWNRKRAKQKMVLFSPSNKNSQQQLSGAREESLELANKFRTESFSENNATRAKFFKESFDANVLHLSMHAAVDENLANKGCLVFSDRKVYLEELYGMRLNGQMAVLSACNTGSIVRSKENGAASLQRAFMYAGIPSTLSSLWEVPDKSTHKIMKYFYDELYSGSTNSEAIRNAKVTYLNSTDDPNLKVPYFWSGFVLSGHEQVISLEKKVKKKESLAGVIALGALIIILSFVTLKRWRILHV